MGRFTRGIQIGDKFLGLEIHGLSEITGYDSGKTTYKGYYHKEYFVLEVIYDRDFGESVDLIRGDDLDVNEVYSFCKEQEAAFANKHIKGVF